MQNSYTLASPISGKIQQRLNSLKAKARFAANLKIILLALVSLLLIFHIFQINDFTKNSHIIGTLEEKITKVSQENKNLEIRFYQKNNLTNIESKLAGLGYSKTDKIHYIQLIEGAITTK